jgi:phosphoribosylglycinamide formyltransferase-1
MKNEQLNIAIITYDRAHRKTQDIITRLLIRGYRNLTAIALPWQERKNFKPLFSHRPSNCEDIQLDILCKNLSIACEKMKVEELCNYFSEKKFNHILIAGAGLLPDELVLNHNIINSHPGYLPYSKGLDAFKWAIYNGMPLGATVHYVMNTADEGTLICQELVNVEFTDTFHSVANRLYELEVKLLVESIDLLEGGLLANTSLSDANYSATRRMPHRIEIAMMARFEAMRLKSQNKNQEI